ncbi:MAG: FHA domain-containing protein [Acidimicrobiales bacterium]|nr:FHA domain-containing protein [Acidimicrobiales bacterium]
MSEQLLDVLKLCLLALLYLFFVRVLWAVWSEVRAPRRRRRAAPPPKAGKPGKAGPHLRVVEPKEQRGRVYPMAQEMTVGRAAGCHVPVDDGFVSQLHARVFARDGQYLVEDLGSTNGTFLNEDKVGGPQVMRRGDKLRVGSTVLELR